MLRDKRPRRPKELTCTRPTQGGNRAGAEAWSPGSLDSLLPTSVFLQQEIKKGWSDNVTLSWEVQL